MLSQVSRLPREGRKSAGTGLQYSKYGASDTYLTTVACPRRRILHWIASWKQDPGDAPENQNDQTQSGAAEPVEDTASIRSRRSNQSAQSAGSQASVLSFRSFKSHFSRLSRMSGSSQRSYENPVLESVQTILDLATKLEAESKPTILGIAHRSSGNRATQCTRYTQALKRLKEQVSGYATHPAVMYSSIHTSPRELVMLCDRVRLLDHGAHADTSTGSLALDSDLLNEVCDELASWFDNFFVVPDQQAQRYQAYISSPLRHEIHHDGMSGEVEGFRATEMTEPVEVPIPLVQEQRANPVPKKDVSHGLALTLPV
ncbi:uncharacterized protein B0H64DRAFT_392827 [Chaetomium fimeti]|uniref:Uncharacterized protein n=1 Tax=Chaetomium fimeti TaxID=1854472 RepID=A0AAE0HJF4_9PEZI|nr:hypothetical protein B0H64DRAFT_392827 [Chaetomium fimeti]